MMSANPTIAELDRRIAIIRRNLRELIEQAAAFSGAGDEARVADRIANQEAELDKLTKLRDSLSKT
jgi:enolase